MLRPSRPIILPFMSSFGSWTTEIVASDTWSVAHFWIALTIMSRAFLSDSSLTLASPSFIILAVSILISSSTVFNNCSFACSEVKPEIRSSSFTRCSLNLSTLACFSARFSSLSFKLCSLLSIVSAFLSIASSLLRIRCSNFCISALRSLTSFSSSFLVLRLSSFASRSISFFCASASLIASSIISRAFFSADPIVFSTVFLRINIEIKEATTAHTTHMATHTIVFIGAPPYLIIIVQIQHKNYTFWLMLCQVMVTYDYSSIYSFKASLTSPYE